MVKYKYNENWRERDKVYEEMPDAIILYWLYAITLNRKYFISNTYVNKYTVHDGGESALPTQLCRLYQ